jgi:hypothetical protein
MNMSLTVLLYINSTLDNLFVLLVKNIITKNI